MATWDDAQGNWVYTPEEREQQIKRGNALSYATQRGVLPADRYNSGFDATAFADEIMAQNQGLNFLTPGADFRGNAYNAAQPNNLFAGGAVTYDRSQLPPGTVADPATIDYFNTNRDRYPQPNPSGPGPTLPPGWQVPAYPAPGSNAQPGAGGGSAPPVSGGGTQQNPGTIPRATTPPPNPTPGSGYQLQEGEFGGGQVGGPGRYPIPDQSYPPNAGWPNIPLDENPDRPMFPGRYGYQPRTGTENAVANRPDPSNPGRPVFTTTGEDLQYRAEGDRNQAIARGEQINAQLGDTINRNTAEESLYEDAANRAYSPIAAGYGGRSAAERAAILREDELYGLQQTGDEAERNFLTQGEQTAITGDPWEQLNRWTENVGVQNANLANLEGNVRGALGGQDAQLRGAVDRYRTNLNTGLTTNEQAQRSVVDPSRLTLSEDYQRDYAFTDRDAQDLKDAAARRQQAGTAAAIDRIRKNAAAGGNTNALALAAAENRARLTGDISGYDAANDANILARRLQLEAAQGRENTRLGSEQAYSGLASATERDLAGQRLGSADALAGQTLDTERYLGGSRLGAETGLGSTRIGTQQTLADTGVDVARNFDETQSQRAADIAANRQNAERSNQETQYGRGRDIYGTASAANRDFSDTRRADEGEYRGFLTGQQTQAGQNASVAQQQQIGNFGTQQGAQNAATGNAIQNYGIKGLGERIAGLFADGGVVRGPQPAVVGEAGPELVIDLERYQPGVYGKPRMADGGVGIPDDQLYSEGGMAEYPAVPVGGPQPLQKQNPLYRRILGGLHQVVTPPPPAPGGSTSATDSMSGGGGGFLESAARIAGAFAGVPVPFADGGTVIPESRYLGNGATFVNGPQTTILGDQPEAVVPLTPRKNPRVTMADLPRLKSRYGMTA